MPTKEEILHSHPIVANNNGSDLYISLESARRAMDEYAAQYAKQQCIAFFEHLKRYASYGDNTPEQLYNLFIEQQNQNK